MQYTESDLEALKAALINGTSSVSIGDRTVTFRSVNELKSLIKEIEENISAQASTPKQTKMIQASWCKK